MPFTLYEVSLGAFINHLGYLRNNLKKGETYANKNGIPLSDFCEAQLAPDMGSLTFQIQRASDTSRFVCTRVAGAENLSMADNEKTFEDMYARIDNTIAYLQKVKPEDMEGQEEKEVIHRSRTGETIYTSKTYLLQFAIPNFYFHVTTAYDILRSKGVPIGKMDYIGRV